MQNAQVKIGEIRINGPSVSFELLDGDGKRAGLFRMKTSPETARQLIEAKSITIRSREVGSE